MINIANVLSFKSLVIIYTPAGLSEADTVFLVSICLSVCLYVKKLKIIDLLTLRVTLVFCRTRHQLVRNINLPVSSAANAPYLSDGGGFLQFCAPEGHAT